MDTKELVFKGFKMNGFLALFLHLVVLTGVTVACFFVGHVIWYIIGGLCILIWLILLGGYMQLEPNEARVMVFFGEYKGTFTKTGFFWVNPFMDKKKLSLRASDRQFKFEGKTVVRKRKQQRGFVCTVMS